MRKIALVLAMFLFAAPAMAASITAVQVPGTLDVNISWEGAGLVRAFALDITVDGDGTITAVKNANSNYYIYPGTIVIEPNGVVTDYNTPVAEPADHPDTQPGLFTSGITIEMGSLYSPLDPVHKTPPPASGSLITVTVNTTLGCNLALALNGARGGEVLEDGTTPSVDLYGTAVVPECYAGRPDYLQWVAVGKPICWCYPRQCHADADGLQQGKAPNLYYVSTNDLTALSSGWLLPDNQLVGNLGCGDFDHVAQGKAPNLFHVSTNDLTILSTNWLQNPPGDCLPGNRNP